MSNEYEITTLDDIINLTDDQIDRLCAELPMALKKVKAMKELVQQLSGIDIAEKEACKILSPLTWVDDGKEYLDVIVSDEGENELLRFKIEESAK